MTRIVAILLSASLLAGCVTEPAAAETAPAPAATPAMAQDHTLLFFLNPSGQPCIIQRGILDEMGPGLTDQVNLHLVSVADSSSRAMLYEYGVRALPQLILVDEHGEELHRYTAGIQSAESILAALE